MTAPHDQPDAATLLEAVREFLTTEVEPQTEGRLRYHLSPEDVVSDSFHGIVFHQRNVFMRRGVKDQVRRTRGKDFLDPIGMIDVADHRQDLQVGE